MCWLRLIVFLISGLSVSLLVAPRAETVPSRTPFKELRPVSGRPAAFAVSKPVSSFGPAVPDRSNTSKKTADQKSLEVPNRIPYRKQVEGAVPDPAPVLGPFLGPPVPGPSLSFEGLNSDDNAAAYGFRVLPPDTVGDVGFGHYVQAVNLLVRVFDKSGNALTPPFKMSTLFAPLGTPCSTRNDGDPNVLFDPLSDRWILSQFCTQAPPFRQMIAISKTGDPTGEYYLYEFVMPNVKLNDYAKLGVWSNSYLMSTDEFLGGDYAGSGVFAFDRQKLLSGDPAAGYVYFDLASPTTLRIGGLLPADIDGLRPPPTGSPGIFVGYTATEYGDASDSIRLFELNPDFADPENSTFAERAESPINVASFDPTSPVGRDDIAQPTPGEKLDSQSDRLMYRVAYRNSGSFDSLVFNQSVRVTPSDQTYRAGVRLYELRRNSPASAFAVNEAVTVGSAETSRFMGAAAMDHRGDLAVAYSTSNENKQPSIVYTGRTPLDPAGTLRPETELIVGSGVQKAFGFRWGDYSGLAVDPVNDCDFWATNEYYTLESQETSDFGWLTRVGRFRFAECDDAARVSFGGTVTDANSAAPIAGATVAVDSVFSRSTDQSGLYSDLYVPSGGNVSVSASAHGYRSETRTVTLPGSGTVTENFALVPVALLQNEGYDLVAESCAVNKSIEPAETVTINVSFNNAGAADALNLTAALLPTGGVRNPGPAQNYGTMPANGPTVSRPFTFTASPDLNCGDDLVLTFQLSDSGSPLENISIVIKTGRPRIAFSENFDSVNSPSLPSGWTTSTTGAQQPWTTSTVQTQSLPNSAFSPDPNQVGLNELVSPPFQVMTTGAILQFRNWYELETTFLRNRLYDGSVLEIKIGDGAWADIEAAGGVFLSGGYDGVIDACCSNPLAGRRGWSGRSGPNSVSEFITSRVRLPASAAGNSVRLRWRIGTDIGTFRTGQFIDDLVVTDGSVCDCVATARRAPFDFDGDGKSDLSVFRPSDAPDQPDFLVLGSSNSASIRGFWGSVGDIPVNADFDGDGRTDLAVFRPSSRVWFVLESGSGFVRVLNFGLSDDQLIPADFDGDGKADIAVFRPSDGNWYITGSSDSQVRIKHFGLSGDLPVPADFDGDGKEDLAVYRPSEGNWYIENSGSATVRIEKFGLAGDRPDPGDFDGDGKSDLCVFRPSDRVWYQLKSSAGFYATQFGLSDDVPLAADFDGDGVRDIAVFRPSTAVWYYLGSTIGFRSQLFGQPGDTAVPGIFVP